jgi:hypothetical protein
MPFEAIPTFVTAAIGEMSMTLDMRVLDFLVRLAREDKPLG